MRHVSSGKTVENSGAEWETTNNRMELQAVIEGLQALKRPTAVKIITDSSYVEMGLSQWMTKWKRNHWRRKTSGGYKAVKNVELWQELDLLSQKHTVTLHRIRGHAGHPENEHVDALAVAAYRELMEREEEH